MAKKKKYILWVEDDSQLIHLYTELLGKEPEIKIEFMIFGKQAIDRIKEIQEGKAEKPDLIMLDLLLPDVNGDKIMETIRQTPATKDIPVYILTNYGGEEMEAEMTETLNAQKYLIKTEWDPTKLSLLIKEALE